MSWIERIKEGIRITTGDGKEYTPFYFLSEKDTEFNTAEFEFPEIEGTLVYRGTPKGSKHTITFGFQGDNHVEESNAFQKSSNDRRAWNVYHPIYGNLTLQPLSLNIDPTGYNVTKITGKFIETITDVVPKITIDPKNKVSFDFQNTNDSFSESFSNDIVLGASDISLMNESLNNGFDDKLNKIDDSIQSNLYFDLFNKANNAISVAASDISTAIGFVANFYTYPSLFKDSVQARLNLLIGQFDDLTRDLENLTTKNQKKIYELNAGLTISAMVNSCVNPIDSDYQNSEEVVSVIETILSYQNQYISNLDSLQSGNGSQLDSYIPYFQPLNSLISLVDFAVSELFEIAFSSSQERSFILKEDSNVVLITHRLYGLDQADSNMDKIIQQNKIGLNEILQLEKGREIVYYI